MLEWDNYKQNKWVPKEPGVIRILSIDGGGMKGIIPAQYLKLVEREIGQPVHSYFDLLTGTSTGGIICLGLSSGISASDVTDLYLEEGKEIFGRKKSRGFLKALYDNESLKRILESKFANKKIKDSKTMLCIPSIEHQKAEPKVYKTPHHSDYMFDAEKFMWEVGLATSSAPLYFPPANIGENECKIDGGLWANNPVLVGIAEAKKLGFSLDKIKVFSIGTGDVLYKAKNGIAKAGGILSWNKNLVNLTMQAQSKGAWHTANYLIKENLTRLNPTLTNPIKLDSNKREDLLAMVHEATRLFEWTYNQSKVKENFFTLP